MYHTPRAVEISDTRLLRITAIPLQISILHRGASESYTPVAKLIDYWILNLDVHPRCGDLSSVANLHICTVENSGDFLKLIANSRQPGIYSKPDDYEMVSGCCLPPKRRGVCSGSRGQSRDACG